MEGFVCFMVCVLMLVDSCIMWKGFKKYYDWKKYVQARVEQLNLRVDSIADRLDKEEK